MEAMYQHDCQDYLTFIKEYEVSYSGDTVKKGSEPFLSDYKYVLRVFGCQFCGKETTEINTVTV